ncbi:MAG: TIR domain-containing protein, partial [candidate division KSB1 bacterium]
MPHAFISYAREDSAFALQLAKDLRAVGREIWIDKNIKAGESWPSEVQQAIETCEYFLAILSHHSVVSKYVKKEITVASSENKIIVPIILHKCNVPLLLRDLQYVDFTVDFQAGFQTLLEALHIRESDSAQSQPQSSIQPESKTITPLDDMVLIPAGLFLMGSEKREEETVHKVHVDAIYKDRQQDKVEQHQN